MLKAKTMLILALLCVSMTACGTKIEQPSQMPAAEITASETTEAVTETETAEIITETETAESIPAATTAAAVTTAIPATAAPVTSAAAVQTTVKAAETTVITAPTMPTEQIGLSQSEMTDASKQLIQEYAGLYDGVLAGWIDMDETYIYDAKPEHPYYHVTDPNFQSIADVKNALAKTMTGEEYDRQYYNALDGDVPVLLEWNGKLYHLPAGKGAAYSGTWKWDQLQFMNVTADSFTVTAQYLQFDEYPITQTFHIVRTTEGFRICSISDVVNYNFIFSIKSPLSTIRIVSEVAWWAKFILSVSLLP